MKTKNWGKVLAYLEKGKKIEKKKKMKQKKKKRIHKKAGNRRRLR